MQFHPRRAHQQQRLPRPGQGDLRRPATARQIGEIALSVRGHHNQPGSDLIGDLRHTLRHLTDLQARLDRPFPLEPVHRPSRFPQHSLARFYLSGAPGGDHMQKADPLKAPEANGGIVEPLDGAGAAVNGDQAGHPGIL
jgi:hypothetical protein